MEDRDSTGDWKCRRKIIEVIHGKQSTGERDDESNEDKLETRVMRLEEQTKWMYDRMRNQAHGTEAFHGNTKMREMNGKGGKEAGGFGSIKTI